MNHIVAIDIGNHSSILTYQDDANYISALKNEFDNFKVPSLMSFTDSQRLYGENTTRYEIERPYSSQIVVNNFKRMLGIERNSMEYLRNERRFMNFKLNAIKGDEFTILNIDYLDTLMELSFFQIYEYYLSYLIKLTYEQLGIIPTTLKISVPGYYTYHQKKLVIEIGLSLGVEIVLISDLVALSLSYVLDNQESLPISPMPNKIVCFIDMGESNMSISVNSINKHQSKILYKSTSNIGGRDFDLVITRKLIELIQTNFNLAVKERSKEYFQLLHNATKLKESLSKNQKVSFQLDNFMDSQDITFTVTRSEMQQWCQDLLKSLVEEIQDQLDNSRRASSHIHIVQISGGCVQFPGLFESVEAIFEGKEAVKNTDSTLISRGCLMYGTPSCESIMIRDVNSSDYQISYSNNNGELERINVFNKNNFTPNEKVIYIDKRCDFTLNLSDKSLKSLCQWNIKGITERLSETSSMVSNSPKSSQTSVFSKNNHNVSSDDQSTKIKFTLYQDINELVEIKVDIVGETEMSSTRSAISEFLSRTLKRKNDKDLDHLYELDSECEYLGYSSTQLKDFVEFTEVLAQRENMYRY